MEHGAWSGKAAWSKEHGARDAAWSIEHGAWSGKAAWSKEHGAWSGKAARSVEC
jgi:hypothetical protein